MNARFPFRRLTDIQATADANGHHFFCKAQMTPWHMRFDPQVYAGRFFVTSEATTHFPRGYTVRMALDTGQIVPINPTDELGRMPNRQFPNKAKAKAALQAWLADDSDEPEQVTGPHTFRPRLLLTGDATLICRHCGEFWNDAIHPDTAGM